MSSRKNSLAAIRIGAARDARLERLAATTDRPKSKLLNEAIDNYLDLQQWQLEHIRQGIKELDDGKYVDHDVVMADFARLRRSGKPKARARKSPRP
ncbi:MAG: CopG family transcriptional regulator [Proteobacteria bacterium]|nr:CopG family transcriptional regulator [Pseudomonadota bacterium]